MSSNRLGGAFLPNADYTIGGAWTFTQTPTIGSGAYVTTGATQTLTAKTLTAPTITGIVAGVPDLTLAIGTNLTKFCTTQFDAVTGTTGTTLTNIVGLTGFSVVASGVYRFLIEISGTSTANCGIKLGFKYTTTTLTDLEAVGTGFTASAVACQHTTTATDQASLYAQTAAVIAVRLFGRLTINAAGTIALQAAQNAAHADTTSVYVGSSMTLSRVA
jgi:hypothetical protein